MTGVSAIREAVKSRRHLYANEVELHLSLAAAFEACGIEHEREVQVKGGRIDFLVGAIGVEVKVKGNADALARQLARYTTEPRITHLVVVTTRYRHREVGGVVNGIPIHVIVIGALS